MTGFHLTLPDFVVILGYFAVVLVVGLYFNKRQTESKEYFAGGHQVSWWLAGISHYMSSFSAFTFIAYSQMAYTYGWVAISLFWTTTPACILGGLVFAKRWRRARVVTPVEFLEKRFNAPLRQLFAWAGIPVKIFDDALKIFATALLLSTGLGMDLKVAIILCGAITVAYTILGGLWALVVTDYVQFIMKIAAMLLLLPLALWQAGGLVKAFQGMPAGFLHVTGGPYGWTYLLSFSLIVIVSYNATWALAQKYYSVPDERSASKAAYLSAGLNFVGTPLMLLPAIVGRKILPDLLAQNRTADTYILLVLKLLPAGIIGIIVAAMFSATMAAISADLNAIASVLTRDVYLRLINPASSERRQVRIGRLSTLFLGSMIVCLSLWIALTQSQTLFHLMVTAFGVFLAPTLLPVLGGLTIRSLTWKGALTGFTVGLTAGLTLFAIKTWYLPAQPNISQDWANYTFEGISIFLTFAATAAGMWLGSVLPRRDRNEEQKIAAFFASLDKPITSAEVGGKTQDSATTAVGAATLAVGCLLGAAALFTNSLPALSIDATLGLALAGLGGRFFYVAKREKRNQVMA